MSEISGENNVGNSIEDNDSNNSSNDFRSILKTKGLTKTYHRGREEIQALKDVDFVVGPGRGCSSSS
jgi:hypothetical protein